MAEDKSERVSRELPLDKGEVETLVALVETGPVWAGSIPCKSGRRQLILRGYAFQTLVAGEEGYTAVTPLGVEAYKRHFGTALGGKADTVSEARANRIAQAGLKKMIYGDKQ